MYNDWAFFKVTDTVDLAIVGGGPAGLAAAEAAASFGLSVVIIDEQQQLGGQILRQPPSSFRVDKWLPGHGYRKVKAQLARAQALPLRFFGGTSVHSVYTVANGFELWLATARDSSRLYARKLLIATGCYDMPVAFPGWTLPGVMSAGAIQAFMKAQQLVPGSSLVLGGTHPLQLVLAEQLIDAGADVRAVLFAQSQSRALRMLARPLTVALNAPLLASAAAAMLKIKRAGVRVFFERYVAAAKGDEEVRSALVAHTRGGLSGMVVEEIACDTIATCYGFLPQTDLPRALGAKMIAIPRTGGWRVAHDAWMRSSVAGLSVAGEVTGVAGASASMLEGRIAGIGLALECGKISPEAARRTSRALRRRLASVLRFAEMLDDLADPVPLWASLASPETIVCRCEDIARQAISQAIDADPSAGADAIKRLTRVGMGRCQGRNCEHQVMAMMLSGRGAGFAPRMPVRPVTLGAIVASSCPD